MLLEAVVIYGRMAAQLADALSSTNKQPTPLNGLSYYLKIPL